MARKKRKKRDFTELVLVALTILVLLAVFAVVLAMVYPRAARSIIADYSQSFESGKGGPGVMLKKVGKRAGEGYNARLEPAVRYVGDVLTSLFSGRKPAEDRKEEPRLGPVFAADTCQTGCHDHENLFDQRAFGNVYIDHRLHDAADVSCRECHFDIGHQPKPAGVKQATCLECHRKVKATTECDSCHPPGSLLDKNIVSNEKTKEFLSGSTAGAKSLVPHNFGTPEKAWLSNQGEAPCRGCHAIPDFCNQCHLVFHNEIPDWLSQHGPRILRSEYVTTACWECHSSTWCAGNCHVNSGQVRSRPYLDVPKVNLNIE